MNGDAMYEMMHDQMLADLIGNHDKVIAAVACPLCNVPVGTSCKVGYIPVNCHLTRYYHWISLGSPDTNGRTDTQPREHPVPCQSCRKSTWHTSAICDDCKRL